MKAKKEVNIVILDDMTTNLVELAKIVSDLGYTARPVITVSQAWKALKVCEPTVLLLDIAMPEMSGFSFYHRLKQKPQYKDLPVIFISAYEDAGMKQEAFYLGAVDFISRPFSAEELGYRIKRQVDIVRKFEKISRQNQDLQKLLLCKMEEKNEDKKKVAEGLIYYVMQREGSMEHMQRVSGYAKQLAGTMMLMTEYGDVVNANFIDILSLACMLHDIGLAVEKVQKGQKSAHTTYGVEPLKQLYQMDEGNDYIKMALDIAMCHHERYDGTGYPNGLVAGQIPLSAQIVSIVLMYDRLRNDPYYMGERTKAEIEAAIIAEEGKAFDPLLVRAFSAVHLSDSLDKKSE